MIAKLIKDLRAKYGFTLAMFAQRTGLSVGYIHDIESGRANGSLEALQKIANRLGLKLVIRIEDENGADVIKDEKVKAYDEVMNVLRQLVKNVEEQQ